MGNWKNSNENYYNNVEKILLTPDEAARCLSLGRTSVFGLMRTGQLGSIRIGGARRVPLAAVHAFVAAAQCDRRAG